MVGVVDAENLRGGYQATRVGQGSQNTKAVGAYALPWLFEVKEGPPVW